MTSCDREYSQQLISAIQPPKSRPKQNSREKGQAFVILALTFLALLAFVGLVIDVGQLYVTYTHLKRAVDAAAVAAANNIKSASASPTERKTRITEAARDMLTLNQITDVSTLRVYECTDAIKPAAFADMCPNIALGEAPRKLAWVEAIETSPVYFLRLFGIQAIPFKTEAVGEAATVDLVLVFDTSESMASDSNCSDDGVCTTGYDPNDFNPAGCNAADDCYPMRQAKDAARGLIGNLFDGYDRVAVVTYNYRAHIVFTLDSNLTNASAAVDTVGVHDDPPSARLAWSAKSPITHQYETYNPIFPDDRDGDGQDADPGATCTDVWDDVHGHIPGKDMWDDNTGKPCDDDNILDAFDWNNNGDFTDDNFDSTPGTFEDTSLLSTCIGCGMRVATQVLQGGGRSQSLWVIIFLTDGIANLSDAHDSVTEIPASFYYGYCGNNPGTSFWSSFCIDWTSTPRYCIDTDSQECPPDTTHTTTSGPYSVEDYARDMIDAAGLLYSTNPHEPAGEDIIIYSIGLGPAAAVGSPLLRYMANIGDDGARANDLCLTNPGLPYDPATNPFIDPTANCGNYFYSPTGAYLDQVFESIAGRIFTKISR
jgi:hypothetical protein